MAKSNSDSDIRNEPHIRRQAFNPDESEQKARSRVEKDKSSELIHDQVDQSVWDEPAFSSQLLGEEIPENALTYKNWLTTQINNTSYSKSWWTVFLVAMFTGPLSIFGTFFQGSGSGFQMVIVTIIGPATEEVMKIAIALWVVERRPFLFKNRFQILICVIAGGLVFAAIENLIYIHIYLK